MCILLFVACILQKNPNFSKQMSLLNQVFTPQASVELELGPTVSAATIYSGNYIYTHAEKCQRSVIQRDQRTRSIFIACISYWFSQIK